MKSPRGRFYVLGASVVNAIGTKTEVRGKLGNAIIGPFKTRKSADYYKRNPEIGSVAAADRMSRS